MAQYRKKPVVVEAVQVTKEMRNNHGPFPEWAIAHIDGGHTQKIDNSGWLQCKTLEGPLNVSDGDYLIRGINGEVYPCKPDIFEKTYDAVFASGEMGYRYNIVLQDGDDVKRFEFDFGTSKHKTMPPSFEWNAEDGSYGIKTWGTGYLKNK